MCYQFAGLELFTAEWLSTLAGLGTLAATIGIAVIAHRFQRDQATSAGASNAERQQICINRALFRLRNASETLTISQQASDGANLMPEAGAIRFLVTLLKSQRAVIEGVTFSDDELAAMGPERSLLLIELQERGRILENACQAVVDDIERTTPSPGVVIFAMNRINDNGAFGEHILRRYNELGQPEA